MRGLRLLETTQADVSQAARRLVRTPGFTAIAVASLALAIGVNTLVFSFVNGVLFKPLPFPDASQLVMIEMSPPNNPGMRGMLPPPMYFLLRDHSASFEAVGVYDGGRAVNLAGDAGGAPAERLEGHRISATAFQALGVKPLIGRYHEPTEDLNGATPAVVLSYRLWQRRFGGHADVVGQSALIDGRRVSIIGVMPESFELFDGSSDAWMPFGFAPSATQGSLHWLRGVGRLKPGVSRVQASAEIQQMAREYERQFPDRGLGWTLTLEPLDEAFFGSMRQPLLLLQAAVGLVLLISCANLAALVLTRAMTRGRELAVRAALGESRARMIRSLLAESLLLASTGGIVGAFVGWLSLRPLIAITPAWFPRLDAVRFDTTVFAFSLVACLTTGIVFGLVPAISASRPNLLKALQDAGARASGGPVRIRQLQALVAVQVTLAFVLLVGAGLVITSMIRLQHVDLGVDTAGLLSLDVQLPRAQYMKQGAGQAGGVSLVDYSPAGPLLYDRIHEALQAVPGVQQAAGVGNPPLTGGPGVEFRIDGQPANGPHPYSATYTMVTANYFRTMKMRMIRGRDFTDSDQAGSPWVIVVNEALAREYWTGEDALAKRLRFTFYEGDNEPFREVVGVVADAAQYRGETQPEPMIYAVHRQQLVRQRASLESQRLRMSYVVRTAGDPMTLVPLVRQAVARIDPSQPVTDIRTVDSYLSAQMQQPRFLATLFGLFGSVSLIIAAIGIYGVTAHSVTERHREFGIRRALGASTGDVLRLVLRRSLAVIACGVVLGAAASRLLTRFIAGFLWGVTPSDPATFATIATILVATGILACLVPGSRATRVDPLVALKHD